MLQQLYSCTFVCKADLFGLGILIAQGKRGGWFPQLRTSEVAGPAETGLLAAAAAFAAAAAAAAAAAFSSFLAGAFFCSLPCLMSSSRELPC